MFLINNEIYLRDVCKVLHQIKNLKKLNNSKILITGATGLVCSAVVELLLVSQLKIDIYIACRNISNAKKIFGDFVKYIKYDANEPISFDYDFDYIIHGASNASPNLYVTCPVETMKSNINGIENLLEYSIKRKINKIIYISSSEIYGSNINAPFNENDYGYIDILNSRSSYANAKRASETMCIAYQKEYGQNINIVRLGHIYGPTFNLNDKRLSTDFIMKASKKENLILKSYGSQIRSYCYSLDCASAILTVLIEGKSGEAYNISNKNSIISIKQFTEYLSEITGSKILFDIPTNDESKSFNPMINSSLDSSKIEKLGWKALFDAKTGLKHSVQVTNFILNNFID